jgi:hypothetical protein
VEQHAFNMGRDPLTQKSTVTPPDEPGDLSSCLELVLPKVLQLKLLLATLACWSVGFAVFA